MKMKSVYKYARFALLLFVITGLVSCDTEEQTEFNLPGEWYTSEEIDFGAYTWGRGTVMTFNARNQGTIGSFTTTAAWHISGVPKPMHTPLPVHGTTAGGSMNTTSTDSLSACGANNTPIII